MSVRHNGGSKEFVHTERGRWTVGSSGFRPSGFVGESCGHENADPDIADKRSYNR